MSLHYRTENPYTRPSQFQYRYPIQPSLSCSTLQTYSICPKKKYSKNNWYDYQSSSLQLSQKVLYRMFANYHKLQQQQQNKNVNDQHNGSECLLNNYCKKNPFHRGTLVQEGRYGHSFFQNPQQHWANQKSKMFLKEPSLYKNSSETVRDYGDLKRKIAKQKQRYNQTMMTRQPTKKAFQDTFGDQSEEKNQNSSQRLRQYLPFQNKKASKRISEQQVQNKIQNNLNGLLTLTQSKKFLKKNQSNGTFANRNSYIQIPSKITYQGKQFFFVQLGIREV